MMLRKHKVLRSTESGESWFVCLINQWQDIVDEAEDEWLGKGSCGDVVGVGWPLGNPGCELASWL